MLKKFYSAFFKVFLFCFLLLLTGCSSGVTSTEIDKTIGKEAVVIRDLAFFSDYYASFPKAEEKKSSCKKHNYADKIQLSSFNGLASRDVYESFFSFTGLVETDILRLDFFSFTNKKLLKTIEFFSGADENFSFDLRFGNGFELGSNLYLVRGYRCDGMVIEKIVELYGHGAAAELILKSSEKKLLKNDVGYFLEKGDDFDTYFLYFFPRSLDKQILELPGGRMLIYQVLKTGDQNLSFSEAVLMVKDTQGNRLKSSQSLIVGQLGQNGQQPVLKLYRSGAFILRTDSVFDGDGEEYFFQPQNLKLISLTELMKKKFNDDFSLDFSVELDDGKLIISEYKPCCGRGENRKLQTYFFDSLTLDYLGKK
ncbi:MAG TPA: hypothetical protein PKD96_00610 [Candidatus Absconditabacterales bacterium]|nr:hypothetical protein [Candidatus Absconditabacterales bacterium]HMT26781.1 hypothetical protein [Candidatus Absconditabacterales bacterium]